MKYSFSAFSLPHQNTQFEETRIHHKTHAHSEHNQTKWNESITAIKYLYSSQLEIAVQMLFTDTVIAGGSLIQWNLLVPRKIIALNEHPRDTIFYSSFNRQY